jgi:hypothetical protein
VGYRGQMHFSCGNLRISSTKWGGAAVAVLGPRRQFVSHKRKIPKISRVRPDKGRKSQKFQRPINNNLLINVDKLATVAITPTNSVRTKPVVR